MARFGTGFPIVDTILQPGFILAIRAALLTGADGREEAVLAQFHITALSTNFSERTIRA